MIAIVSVASGRNLYVDNRAGDDRFDGSVATSVDPGAGRFARFRERYVLLRPAIEFCWPTPGVRTVKASASSAAHIVERLIHRL